MVMHLILVLAMLASAQDPHQRMNHRGAMVMGFDQDKTAHHFYLHDDGGAIDIAVMDPTDAQNRDAIRSHLPHVASMFAAGDFGAPMLVHDSKNVPGTKVLASLKARIHYTYVETPSGGRLDIVTTNRDALAALHEFLAFQIADHKTGDSLTVTRRK
jgi:hypothetical protein